MAVEKIAEAGTLICDAIQPPGMFVHRIVEDETENRIKQSSVRERSETMIRSALAIATASLFIAACTTVAGDSDTLDEVAALEAQAAFEIDVQTARVAEICLAPPRRAFQGRYLEGDLFDARFYHTRVDGRGGRHMLVEFSNSCLAIRNAGADLGPRTPFCETDVVRFSNERCMVERIYEVPNEASARALAIKLQVERAREAGVELPENDIEAAAILVEMTSS